MPDHKHSAPDARHHKAASHIAANGIAEHLKRIHEGAWSVSYISFKKQTRMEITDRHMQIRQLIRNSSAMAAQRIHDLQLMSLDERWSAHTYEHTLVFQKIHAMCCRTKKVRKKCRITANNINADDIMHVTYRIEVNNHGVTTIDKGFAPDVLAHKIANSIEELLIIKSVH